MPDKPSPDDLKGLWRKQETEPPRISLERFEHKARKLQEKARREVYTLSAVALGLVVVLLYALVTAQETAQRVGLGILIVWAILTPFRAHRTLRPGALPVDAVVATSIAFYRSQLERHRDYHRHIWLWFVAPMFLGVGIYLSPALVAIAKDTRLAPNALPFFLLLAIWVVVFWHLRQRRLRKLNRKLNTLDELEKQIQS